MTEEKETKTKREMQKDVFAHEKPPRPWPSYEAAPVKETKPKKESK